MLNVLSLEYKNNDNNNNTTDKDKNEKFLISKKG